MKKIIFCAATIAMLLVFGFDQSALSAGTYTVTVINDTHAVSPSTSPNDSSGQISVRSAIEAANAQLSPTVINIPPGIYNLAFGELDVATNAGKNITLQTSGGTAASTIINQTNNLDRVFNLDLNSVGNTVVTLAGLTIQGGHDKTDIAGGAGILAGSIQASPKDVLNLNGCIIANNHCTPPNAGYTAQIGGGVQMAGGDLNITNCTFTNNTAGSSSGGAIAFFTQSVASMLTVTNSIFINNGLTNTSGSGPVGGGAIFIGSTANSIHTVKNSTFANNFVIGSSGNTFGGAMDLNTGTLNITNATFTTNSAIGIGGQAGAIYVDAGTNNIGFSRFRGNTATATAGNTILNHASNGATTTAENDWWATNGAPGGMISGFIVNTWLMLNQSANPSLVLITTPTTLYATLTANSAGTAIVPGNLVTLAGLPITFNNAVNGSLSAANTSMPASGIALATFTAGGTAGLGTAIITFDGVVITNSFRIGLANASVANTNDNGAGSLRQALVDVFPGGTVSFNPSLAGHTITLTNGELLVTQNLTINGPGANQLVVSGNQNGRVLDIQPGVTNVISGLTIVNGLATGPNTGFGGGIFNGGDLTLINCTLRGNSTTNSNGYGGGIYSTNTLRLIGCTVGPTNSAADIGGGLYVVNCVLQMLNCTVATNSAIIVGGIAVDTGASAMLTNCTVTGNSDTSYSGGYGGGSAQIKNTIIAGNTSSNLAQPDVYFFGTLVSLGHNLIGVTNNTTGWLATDLAGTTNAPLNARLGPLADNGGPTLTCALLTAPNSPAINAGDNSGATPFDQRGTGFLRIVSGKIDIGAFELIPPILNIAHPPNQPVLFWPTNAGGYVLESSTNLTIWGPAHGVQAVVGNQYFFTNSITGGNQFFRLDVH